MSDKLQQAIQATRAGDTKNAQFLLTQAIQEDPNNPQSWYLLSLLVDDQEKKQTYLTKVIELDPDHTKAHQQLVTMSKTAVLEPAVEESEPELVAVPLSSDSDDLVAQDQGDTLPDWMADDLPPSDETAVVSATEVETVIEEPVPDWLEGSLDEDWDKEKDETAVVETTPAEQKATEEAKPAKKKKEAPKEKKPAKKQQEVKEQQLNYILISLVAIAVIIFFIMAYMIFTMM